MTRAQLVKEASQIPVGGSEEEAKERVKQLFKPRNGQQLEQLSVEDTLQMELEHWLDWIREITRRSNGRLR